MKHSNGKGPGENCIAIAIIIIVAIPLWLPVMVFTIDKFYFTPTRNIETVWNVNIPNGFNQIYHKSSDSIYARADNYTVYETSGKISDFLDEFNFGKQSSIENYVKEIIISLSVPKDYRPPFDNSYCYMYKSYGRDSLVIVYFPDTNRCLFVESFNWDGCSRWVFIAQCTRLLVSKIEALLI